MQHRATLFAGGIILLKKSPLSPKTESQVTRSLGAKRTRCRGGSGSGNPDKRRLSESTVTAKKFPTVFRLLNSVLLVSWRVKEIRCRCCDIAATPVPVFFSLFRHQETETNVPRRFPALAPFVPRFISDFHTSVPRNRILGIAIGSLGTLPVPSAILPCEGKTPYK